MPKKKTSKSKKEKPSLLPIPPKKISHWIWLGVIVFTLITVITVIFGQGYLNLGALRFTPKGQRASEKVAKTNCPKKSVQEGPYCVFTLNPPLEYYTIKEDAGFAFYGPIVTKRFKDNGWEFKEGDVINGSAYSIVKNGFTPMQFTFQWKEKKGKKHPSFVFDRPTAESVQGSRFVDIIVAKDRIIRFNKFNLPDIDLIHR